MDAQAVAYGVGIGLGLAFGANVFTVLTYFLLRSITNFVKTIKSTKGDSKEP